MVTNVRKEVGEIKVRKYLAKKDNSLLRLNEAKIRVCTVPDDEANNRGCPGLRECEELVLVYRPFGCIKEKNKVDLNEMETINSIANPSSACQKHEKSA
jgi:hypothetical protein